MPTVYLRKDLYDAIIMAKKEVNQFVNKVVEAALETPKDEPKEKQVKEKKER